MERRCDRCGFQILDSENFISHNNHPSSLSIFADYLHHSEPLVCIGRLKSANERQAEDIRQLRVDAQFGTLVKNVLKECAHIFQGKA